MKEVSRVSGLRPDTEETAVVRSVLEDLYYLHPSLEGLKVAVVEVWADMSHIFREELVYALTDSSLAVRLAAVKGCTPPAAFRSELDAAFVSGDFDLRTAIVRAWSKDATFFASQLEAAAKDPLLCLEVIRICARQPGEFEEMLSRYFNSEDPLVRMAIVSGWSSRPTQFRSHLESAYGDSDQRVVDMVTAIWYGNPRLFDRELRNYRLKYLP